MLAAVIVSLVLSTWVRAETTLRPTVTFTPEWNKIFTGESITMTCDLRSMAPGDFIFNWYKDREWVHTGKTYTIQQAQESHSGNYQCETSFTGRSDVARLDVSSSYVTLQAPLHIYEGDNVTLRCNHFPGHTSKQTIFYKDNMVIQDWALDSELLIENIDQMSVYRYKCTKQVHHHLLYYQHTDEVAFTAQELFLPPVLRQTGSDRRTLSCDTSLSPLREATELEFAFYKDGHIVQRYSPASRFSIPSSWLKFSGSYTCQVRTSTNTMEKTSAPLHIEGFSMQIIPTIRTHIMQIIPTVKMQTGGQEPDRGETNNLVSILLVTLVVLILVLVVITLIIMYRRNRQQQITNPQISLKDLPPAYSKVPVLDP